MDGSIFASIKPVNSVNSTEGCLETHQGGAMYKTALGVRPQTDEVFQMKDEIFLPKRNCPNHRI